MPTCLFLFICWFIFLPACQAQPKVPTVCHAKGCVSLEVVSTTEDMKRGLMGRISLGENHGMLFVFDHQAPHAFWMKNMRMPIDIVWINQENKIVYVSAKVPACQQDPCAVYKPDTVARYVLELPAGYTTIKSWKQGDLLHFKDLDGILIKDF